MGVEISENSKTFDPYELKWGDTVQELNSSEVRRWIAEDLCDEGDQEAEPLDDLPQNSHDVTTEEVAEYLFKEGLSNGLISTLTGQLKDLIAMAKWYQKGANPSEAETISHLVVPLLNVLGWSPQKMAIEWNYIDIALFSKLPRENKNLSVVLEAKPKGYSCLTAKSQAQTYAERHGKESCKRLILTDGLRYAIYLGKKVMEGEVGKIKFNLHPTAYLNLTRMRDEYPLLKCKGAKEAFLYLSADWVPES